MATKAFNEIMNTRLWDFLPESLQNYQKLVFDNIAANRQFVKGEERSDRPFFLSAKTDFAEKTYVGNYRSLTYWNDLDPEDRIISVVKVEGPILRNGGLCSYGSKEHRDLIMRAADDERVIGFLVEVDSPGGSSDAKYDYQQALDYAKSKGKIIIGHIDGMACSAGYALMSLCEEIYYTNPHNIVGCIGTMCAMYTQKDGDINTVTQERCVKIYADGSPYKNKEYRDAAEGNYEGILKDLNKSCTFFQKLVKERRPKVTEEQLKGYTYEAGDVEGTLVDGIGSFEFCISRIQELSNSNQPKKGKSSSVNKGRKNDIAQIAETTAEKLPESQESSSQGQKNPSSTKSQTTQTQNQTTMAKSYPNIMSAAGVNSLVVEETGGFYMAEMMADNLEAACIKAKQTESTLAAKLTEVGELNALLEKERKEHAEALANLQVQHDASIKALNENHEKEIKAKEESLADAQKQIKAKEDELKELSNAATQNPAPQNPPKDNELHGDQKTEGFKVESVGSDRKMSWQERAAAREERNKQLKKSRV